MHINLPIVRNISLKELIQGIEVIKKKRDRVRNISLKELIHTPNGYVI